VLLRMAAELEGHADNVAACLFGGLALAYRTDDGRRAERIEPSSGLRPVVLIPTAERVSTERARLAVPRSVDLGDAVFNLSRSALLTVAMTVRPDLLAVALDDRLHERHRLPLMPVAAGLLALLRSRGIATAVAGSGPALVAFETEGRTVDDPGEGWRVLRPDVDRAGATIEEEGGG
jgi:homoserine kinase